MGTALLCIPKLSRSPGDWGWGCSLLGLLNQQLQGEGQPSDRDEPSRDLWRMPEAERKDPNWVPN